MPRPGNKIGAKAKKVTLGGTKVCTVPKYGISCGKLLFHTKSIGHRTLWTIETRQYCNNTVQKKEEKRQETVDALAS